MMPSEISGPAGLSLIGLITVQSSALAIIESAILRSAILRETKQRPIFIPSVPSV